MVVRLGTYLGAYLSRCHISGLLMRLLHESVFLYSLFLCFMFSFFFHPRGWIEWGHLGTYLYTLS